MRVHYLEIVTPDVDATCAIHAAMHRLDFGPADPDLGHARVAESSDGCLVGVRSPLADHEAPIVRTYVEVEDIARAVAAAEEGGALVAYPPTRQGKRGTFAILIAGELQHGLWQE